MNSSETTPGCVAILVAAGRGLRAGAGEPKQFRPLRGVPLLARTASVFACCQEVRRLVLVVPDPEDARSRLAAWLPAGLPIIFARGGATRQSSTAAGLEAAGETELVLVHDGVRPFVDPGLILRVIGLARDMGAAIPVLPVRETLKKLDGRGEIAGTVRREEFVLAQTPQGFRPEILKQGLEWARREGWEGTDESEIVEKSGLPVGRVEGSEGNLKITTSADFEMAERILEAERPAGGMRVGIGYDVHALVPGRPLILGGVCVPHPSGPAGHSDGDLICHAATDAILGAAGLPDIGQIFPDSDPTLRGADSLRLLAEASRKAREIGFELINLDLILVAEEPRLVPHLPAMRANLARALGCPERRIGIKGKRGEGLGFEGRREGMAAHAVALLGPGGGA
ncbi:MAG TPA: 2-C-methyl-D-erythritol 4-phosphate cytidylyltransferase [Candidatus Polarisedimenticolia bacterium]|nr:2-C-methyl-D-erythritol 4-phosphate cytidylyltransferase [Candidatus Polarisedimenticolia bacterium]